MKQETVRIILKNEDGLRAVAAASRISTTQGSALEVFQRSGDREKDLKLVKKVLASGHRSVLEHQTFTVAFDGVSVLVEQFMIEFRLASYIVKSRRYVDFSSAGFVVPAGLSPELEAAYRERCEALFRAYSRLLELEVPREDARFVLPYGFRSNFYMTVNGRELVHMIGQMRTGRGRDFPEIEALGRSLAEQFEELYPGVLAQETAQLPPCAPVPGAGELREPSVRTGSAELVSEPSDAEALLEAAMAFSGRFPAQDGCFLTERNVLALVRDARSRELEALSYTFRVRDVSLAGVTHFTRHRILSLMVPEVGRALAGGGYVLPESVAARPEALEIYREVFAGQTEFARRLREAGLPEACLPYLALAGHVTDLLLTLNGRELNHFFQLRTCRRAQWEIRGIARKMLDLLNQRAEDIFWAYGPSCAVLGRCPEGRLSCGKPETRA